jgi:YHS domain-containing protein
MMDIVDVAIHQIVCQKSEFHGKSYYQNSQKARHKLAKNFTTKYANLL